MSTIRNVFLVPMLAALFLGQSAAGADAPGGNENATGHPAQQAIDQLVEETVAHLRTTEYSLISARSLRRGRDVHALTAEGAKKEAQFHQRMQKRLAAIDLTGAPHRLLLEANVLRHIFDYGASTETAYWLEFAVTPYTGGQPFIQLNHRLNTHLFRKPEDMQAYLVLLDDYALFLGQVAAKTRAQAQRGIRVAKPGIDGAIATFTGLHKTAPTLIPKPERLSGLPADQVEKFTATVREKISERIQPACRAVLAIIDDEYRRLAPDDVGIRQYPGGKDQYARRMAFEGFGMTPREIHERAKRDVADIERQMKAVRDKLNFRGTADEFHQKLRKERQLVFHTPAEVEERYGYFLERIEKRIPDYFWKRPRTPYGYAPLDPAVDNGTRGGGGQRPTEADPVHRYVYPTFDLANRSLEVGAAHRIYHELVPGHYFQGTLLTENPSSSNLRRLGVRFSGYAEGWANYAASLAMEMGVLDDPYDLYLELLAQANGACRSVIDTGMNYLGMSLDEARAYLREHSPIMSDVAIVGETLRFGADNFGQSVSYWMGFVKIWDARRRAEKALGSDFNIRDFHSIVMDDGTLPLDALDMHVDWWVSGSKAQRQATATRSSR